MTLVAVENSEEPLVEWVTPALTIKRGRDPLGLQTITLDRVMPALLPGVLALSERARYTTIYPFLLSEYQQRRLAADNASLGDFIRLREYELCLAMQLCERCDASRAIGSDRARPDARAEPAEFQRRHSVESSMGGYGLYYRSPLVELDVVIPAGAALGEISTRIDLLNPVSERANTLAESFRETITDTTYYARGHMNGVDPIPLGVIRELSEAACLCRLDQRPAEQQAIRDAYFEAGRAERADPVEQRCRAFALFLEQLDRHPDVAWYDSDFRRGTVDAFHREPFESSPRADAYASWGALAMKECVQDAICSMWTEFCRRGLDHQEHDGMIRSELHSFIHERLAGAGSFELGGTPVSGDPSSRWASSASTSSPRRPTCTGKTCGPGPKSGTQRCQGCRHCCGSRRTPRMRTPCSGPGSG